MGKGQRNRGKRAETSRTEYCSVPGCDSDARYEQPGGESVIFHKFPRNATLKAQWVVKIRRDEDGDKFKITKKSYVCSKHFLQSDYGWAPVRKTMLRPGSIPTQFWWTKQAKPRDGKATQRQFIPQTPRRPKCEMKTYAEASSTAEPMEVEEPNCPAPLPKSTEELYAELKILFESKEKELREKLEKVERFGVTRFLRDDRMINFYTGFATYDTFLTFYRFIEPTALNMQSRYYKPVDEGRSLKGRPRCMPLIDEFFMYLCRLKVGLFEEDLAERFDCSYQTVSRKLITWVNYLYFVLGSINIWLPREVIQELMPEAFKAEFGKTRVVIDCTEIRCQHPSSLVLNSQLYSNYKSYTTLKCLLGISPHGALTFVSPLYTGAMSDVEITKLCGITDLLEVGDSVMADKGFVIGKLLEDKEIALNLPPFLGEGKQFPVDQVHDTQTIASLRIHIERFNRRVKEYHFFDTEIPLNFLGSINQMWTVACLLANFKGPLIAQKE